MLAWVKALIKVRRSHIAFNDGDINRVMVSSDDEHRTLVMERDEARVVINFGEQPYTFALLPSEKLELISRNEVGVTDSSLELPPTTIAILMSSREEVENRQASRQNKRSAERN